MLRATILAALAASILAACAAEVRGPSVAVRYPVVTVEPDHDRDRGGGFCPPGQAKKGRC